MIYPLKTCAACGRVWQPRNRYQSVRNRTCGYSCSNRLRFGPRAERLASKIAIGDGCWEWLGAMTSDGYGNFTESTPDGFVNRPAHRVVYEDLVGAIPAGLTIDHLCRNRGCVNPAHLEPVTMRENTMRGESFAAVNAAKTNCPKGHALTPENVYRWPGARFNSRACRACLGAARRSVDSQSHR